MDKNPKIREYQGKGVTIQYDVKRCIHAEECIHALPQVFSQHQRPWVQPRDTPAEDLVDAVLRCPSGAPCTSSGRTGEKPSSHQPDTRSGLLKMARCTFMAISK